jgi:hypothetical protein
MEKTMFTKFCQAQNLHIIFQSPDYLHTDLEEILDAYGRTFQSDIRGTLHSDTLAYDETFSKIAEKITWTQRDMEILSDDTYQLLRSWILAHGGDSDAIIPCHAFV